MNTYKHRADGDYVQVPVRVLSLQLEGARDDRQTGTHQATQGASLASQLADTQHVTHGHFSGLLQQPAM